MIDFNTLRYFTSAFEAGTFSHAARLNGVSQPTISVAIQKLEDRFGSPLFQRSKKGLTPLPLATRLYHDVIESVTHLASIEARLLDETPQSMKIHCAPDMLMRGIAPNLNSLRRNTKNLQFSFTDDPRESDLAYVSEGCVPETHTFIPLAEEPFRVAVARFHPFASSPEISVSDLRTESIIHRPYCPNADRLEFVPSQIKSAAQVTNDQQLLDLIAAGLGIAFVPLSHSEHRDDIAFLSLIDAESWTRKTGISHRKSAYAAKLARQLASNGRLSD